MDMIRHDDERMQLISVEPAIPITQSTHHKLGDFRTLQKQRAAGAPVQETIHGYERLPG
jgi:hypothetical protein